jgi:hypothetical protein
MPGRVTRTAPARRRRGKRAARRSGRRGGSTPRGGRARTRPTGRAGVAAVALSVSISTIASTSVRLEPLAGDALVGAQRFCSHSAISPTDGDRTTERHPAGPSRGPSSTVAPRSRARSVAVSIPSTSTHGSHPGPARAALDDPAVEAIAEHSRVVAAPAVVEALGSPLRQPAARTRSRPRGRRCEARAARRAAPRSAPVFVVAADPGPERRLALVRPTRHAVGIAHPGDSFSRPHSSAPAASRSASVSRSGGRSCVLSFHRSCCAYRSTEAAGSITRHSPRRRGRGSRPAGITGRRSARTASTRYAPIPGARRRCPNRGRRVRPCA